MKRASFATVSVGVVGHRPNRLQPADLPSLTARLGEILAAVKNAATQMPNGLVCLRAVSPLAEGTDRYFAREALRLGYELFCPLPFPKVEFENDFKPGHSLLGGIDSIADFNEILNYARQNARLVLIELDGVRSKAAEAYEAAGRVVLEQSDLLLVVWDGSGGNKRGGTYETLQEALTAGVPTLWIDAEAPHSWQLLERKGDLPICSGDRCVPRQTGPPDLGSVVTRILESLRPNT